MPNPWLYEQKFNDLNLGDLSGQDGWSGAAGFDVVTDNPAEGTKCVQQPSGANWCDNNLRSVGPYTYGTVYISMRSASINGGGAFHLKNSGDYNDILIYFWSGGEIKIYNYATDTWVTIGYYTADNWVRIGIAFEYTAGGYEGLSQYTFKVNVNNGAWSSAYIIRGVPYRGTNISSIQFYRYGGVVSAFDYISPNYSPPPTYPSVDTNAVDDIDIYSATLNGEVTDIGGEECIERGFVYSLASHADPGDVAPGDSDYEFSDIQEGDFSAEAFDSAISVLSRATKYYVRAYAKNENGYAYGDEVNFTTLTDLYPNGIYEPRTKGNKVGVVYTPANSKTLYAEDISQLDEQVVAIETELGTDVKGEHASLKARLEWIESQLP